MGIVKGTVKQNSGGFCKFSVTFCVDMRSARTRFTNDTKIFSCGGVFHSGNRFCAVARGRHENFLDGKILASGEMRCRRIRAEIFSARSARGDFRKLISELTTEYTEYTTDGGGRTAEDG